MRALTCLRGGEHVTALSMCVSCAGPQFFHVKAMIESGCGLQDIRSYDYQFYLQNSSKFSADMRLWRSQQNMFGDDILQEGTMCVWQVMTRMSCVAGTLETHVHRGCPSQNVVRALGSHVLATHLGPGFKLPPRGPRDHLVLR
jgi:hypothetical protein